MKTVLSKNYKFFITVFIAGLCLLTTLISVGFGALNQDIKISGTVEYRQDMGNMMAKFVGTGSIEAFHNRNYLSKIKTVDFLDNKNVPSTAVVTWDVSYYSGDKRVMAWIIDDPNNTGYYKLYIGADGDVVANYDSSYLFKDGTEITSINFNNNYDTSKAENMKDMFYNCRKITSFDVSSFNTSSATNMSEMFGSCFNLISLNLSNFDTHNVTDMSQMFIFNSAMTSVNVSSFDTSKVTIMYGMFSSCMALTTLDVSNFNTSLVTSFSSLFAQCYGLTSLNLSNFNTSNVNNMQSTFAGCEALTSLNITSFDTSQVTTMLSMFFDCKLLTTIDLRNFNTSSLTQIENMFYNCKNLTTIQISSSWNVSNVTDSGEDMFYGCTKLPNFNSAYIDITMAKPTTQGGYLTLA